MKFHQNFILSILLLVLLFAIFELKNVVLSPDSASWIINDAGSQCLYSNQLPINTSFSASDNWAGWIVIPLRLLLTFVTAMLITRTAMKNMIFDERSYLPTIIFPIVATGIFSATGSILTLTLSLLQIIIFNLLFDGFKRSNSIKEFFYASILTAISTLCYTPSAVTFITILLAVAVLNRSFRELFCSIVGFLIPLFLYSYYHWIIGYSFSTIPTKLLASFTTTLSLPIDQWLVLSNRFGLSVLIVSVLPLVTATVIAIVTYQHQLRYARRRQRKFFNLLVFQLLTITTLTFTVPSSGLQMLLLNSVPLTLILSCYFNWNEYRFARLLLQLLPCGILLYNITLIIVLKQ